MDDNGGPPSGRNGGDNAVSSTRLYLGNVARNATKADVERHFADHGNIAEIKLMSGFGFIEYKDPADARDAVPTFHGTDFLGERLIVQFARGPNRERNDYGGREARQPPRPRRTVYRMTISGLSGDTSWQDLKDFARSAGVDVVFSEVGRDRDANGLTTGFVEYETEDDLKNAVDKLNETEFKGVVVNCIADIQSEVPRPPPRERYNRSRSPGYRGSRGYGGPPPDRDYYDRRGPPRGYSPRRDDYRRRSPPRDYYQDGGRDGRDDRGYPPPRRGPPLGDYPPPPRDRYDDRGYGGAPPPPRGGQYEQDPYMNGHGREPYPRHPSPRREARGYDRGGYDNRGPGGGGY